MGGGGGGGWLGFKHFFLSVSTNPENNTVMQWEHKGVQKKANQSIFCLFCLFVYLFIAQNKKAQL